MGGWRNGGMRRVGIRKEIYFIKWNQASSLHQQKLAWSDVDSKIDANTSQIGNARPWSRCGKSNNLLIYIYSSSEVEQTHDNNSTIFNCQSYRYLTPTQQHIGRQLGDTQTPPAKVAGEYKTAPAKEAAEATQGRVTPGRNDRHPACPPQSHRPRMRMPGRSTLTAGEFQDGKN